MKKIVTAVLAASLLTAGCSDFLTEDLKKDLAPENTYTTSYGFEVGITGLYGLARSEYNTWGGSFTSHAQACPYETLQISTDIVFAGHKDGSLVNHENLVYTSADHYVNSFWNYSYGMIASANIILQYSETDVKWDKPEDKEKYQAEARFFRAYAYRYLVYLYGDVPYVDKVEENFRLDFTRTPKAEVLGHMIEDLKFAASKLPEKPDQVVPGRLTRWAAEHLLAEVYLMAGMPGEAEAAAERVIESKEFELMENRFGVATDEPGDVFSDLFIEYNARRTNGNKETIWIMPLEYNTTGGGGASEDWTRRAWVPKYWEVNGFVLADTLGGRGLAQLVPLDWWNEKEDFYDPTDIRNSEHNIKRNWYYNDPDNKLYGTKVLPHDTFKIPGKIFPAVTKFFYGKKEDLSYNGLNKDRIKFRLAETYLLKAEAQLLQNNKEGAAKSINKVRERAGASAITASDVTEDFLLDERIRELIGEELRRFTLLRFGKLKERTVKYNFRSDHMKDYQQLWPIPQTIIDSNTGAKFPQNPGYGDK
ncbi:MAG: RagB/SusD family nutrient uptake outer membrane protein [Tannerellaceae bacterium]|nr:RagB/SusD family nutrient uptake outer membrane protein [Tannerellaceae bacterium]